MSINNLENKIKELKELEAIVEEANAEAEEIRDSIKKELEDRQTEELICGPYVVRFTSVLTTRFDTKRFKEAFGDELYKAYTKEIASRRFQIA